MTIKKFLAKDFQKAARALRDNKVEEVKAFIEEGLPLNAVRFDLLGRDKDTALGFMIETASRSALHESLGQEYIDRTYAERDAIGIILLDADADPAQVLDPSWLVRNAKCAGMVHTAARLQDMGYE